MDGAMWFRLRNTPDNPWLEKDRQDQLKVIATALLFGSAVMSGFGLLVYALVNA